MTFLRQVLRWQAIASALVGLALLVAPGPVVDGLMDQPPTPQVWVRTVGIASIVLAAQMVLVGRKLEDLWWWTWSFVVLEGLVALVSVATAIAGVDGGAEWPWWVATAIALGFGALDVGGLAKAGTERSPV